MNQVRATWIFFQFEYLLIFQQVINDGQVNNHLMKGINLTGPMTTRERQIEGMKSELKQIFINIVRQYLDVFNKNRMLGVECFFRFQSREHKDSILNNYEHLAV
jgi:cell division ATPase FtsA